MECLLESYVQKHWWILLPCHRIEPSICLLPSVGWDRLLKPYFFLQGSNAISLDAKIPPFVLRDIFVIREQFLTGLNF